MKDEWEVVAFILERWDGWLERWVSWLSLRGLAVHDV